MNVVVAVRPLTFTLVAAVKFSPVRMITEFTLPAPGVKLVMMGATVKLAALVTVPPGAVTWRVPVVASVGTATVMVVAVEVNGTRGLPLNFTSVAPLRLVPVIVTTVPGAPTAGVKLVMVGGPVVEVTVKLPVDPPVPQPPVTLRVPVVAPAGTVAVMLVADPMLKAVALVPLNFTAVAPVKPVPIIVTLVPTAPLAGVKLVMAGAAVGVKLLTLVAVPLGAVTLMGPAVAPAGTTAVMLVALSTVKLEALVPLNFTAVAPVKPVPVMVTVAPAQPLVGVKLLIVGTADTVMVKLTFEISKK